MTRLRCYIIDDEPVARKIIREYIGDIDFLEIAGEADNVADLMAYGGPELQLLFLDIQLPGVSGIHYLRHIAPAALTIITTAYPQFALQGYELNVLDYLVKPISETRFQKAVNKALEFYTLKAKASYALPAEEMLFIRCDRRIERILIRDILYVEAMANYVIVHTDQRRYITYLSFTGMSGRLPESLFVRIHKSYLVSLPALTSVRGNKACIGPVTLPISRHYRSAVLERIKAFA